MPSLDVDIQSMPGRQKRHGGIKPFESDEVDQLGVRFTRKHGDIQLVSYHPVVAMGKVVCGDNDSEDPLSDGTKAGEGADVVALVGFRDEQVGNRGGVLQTLDEPGLPQTMRQRQRIISVVFHDEDKSQRQASVAITPPIKRQGPPPRSLLLCALGSFAANTIQRRAHDLPEPLL